MEKTIRSLVLLMIITGMIFTACGPENPAPVDAEDVNKVEVEIGDTIDVKDAKEIEERAEVKKEGSEKTDIETESKIAPVDKSEPEPVTVPAKTETNIESNEPTVEVKTKYADGTYTNSGGYQNPAGAESVTLTVTVKDDVVQSLNVISNAVNETTKQMQGLFISGINQLVVGKKLDEVFVSGNVNGSSLTGGGFNNAVASIKAGALR